MICYGVGPGVGKGLYGVGRGEGGGDKEFIPYVDA